MVLHTFGGVYLDTDVECYTNLTPWLDGADLVIQEEVRDCTTVYLLEVYAAVNNALCMCCVLYILLTSNVSWRSRL